MTMTGWVTLSILALVGLYFGAQLIRDIVWNRKLIHFQKTLGEAVVKAPTLFWIKRSYGVVITGLFIFATAFSGAFSIPLTLDERVLVNAKPVSSEARLRELMSTQSNGGFFNGWFRFTGAVDNEMAPQEGAMDDFNGSEDPSRDFIGTNNQVEGVEESDIVKTDGNMIYYASRYQNQVRIFTIELDGEATLDETLDLGDLYTDSMFLTDEYLIIIGYTYTVSPYKYDATYDMVEWAYVTYTGSVVIYDRDTLEVAYDLQTDANFYQYRLIDNALFLVGNKYIQNDEFRPTFTEKVDGDETTSFLDYDQIYYFDDVPVYGMTVFTGIDLDDFDINSKAFLGNVNQIYADVDTLYTTFSFTKTNGFIDGWLGYTTQTQIMKFNLNTTDATFEYVGQGIVDGYVENQYWMDEYDNYFRVVTSSWNPITNRLYVLSESSVDDELNIVGSITSGLGKINETVKSVRFNGEQAFVVTFEQTDPLYTIDLSNPTDPKIISAIEEPGYSTYLHVWNDEGTQLIGFGFTADSNGRVTGLKISAYDNRQTEPLETYQLNATNEEGTWSYSYSEASYNPKALMISPDHGIIAFPVMSWTMTQVDLYEYEYTYVSQFLIFYIDFSNEDHIISDPIVIEHPESPYYFGIERGIYISQDEPQAFEQVYTFSNMGMVSYDLLTGQVVQTIPFELPEWYR
ncbi:MAG TPA: beta-propeller domain-containing protein [Acholeplasmataceae bacterium]|nr:beta-propeller domain-containing protein [Acholeplasmataceae bacterium]